MQCMMLDRMLLWAKSSIKDTPGTLGKFEYDLGFRLYKSVLRQSVLTNLEIVDRGKKLQGSMYFQISFWFHKKANIYYTYCIILCMLYIIYKYAYIMHILLKYAYIIIYISLNQFYKW